MIAYRWKGLYATSTVRSTQPISTMSLCFITVAFPSSLWRMPLPSPFGDFHHVYYIRFQAKCQIISLYKIQKGDVTPQWHSLPFMTDFSVVRSTAPTHSFGLAIRLFVACQRLVSFATRLDVKTTTIGLIMCQPTIILYSIFAKMSILQLIPHRCD